MQTDILSQSDALSFQYLVTKKDLYQDIESFRTLLRSLTLLGLRSIFCFLCSVDLNAQSYILQNCKMKILQDTQKDEFIPICTAAGIAT